MKKPLVIDLFCGAGGMSEGLIQAGFHIVFSSDLNKDAAKTYINRHEQLGLIQDVNTHFELDNIKNLKGKIILENIKNLTVFKDSQDLEIDAIFGGPPCQGFSRAGKRIKNDPRNMLFGEYVRVISEIRPKYIVMENVVGFMDTRLEDFISIDANVYNGEKLAPDILKSEFTKIGYNFLEPRILDASDYGVPQKRKRLIFLAYRNDQKAPKYPEKLFTNEEDKITIEDAINDLYKVNSIKTQYQKDSSIGRTEKIVISKPDNLLKSKQTEIVLERNSLFKEGENIIRLRERLSKDGIELKKYKELEKLIDAFDIIRIDKENVYLTNDGLNKILTKKRSKIKLHRKKPSPTVLSIADDFISPFDNQTMSVREMARLQSFDDSFVFLGPRTTGGARRKFEVPQYTQVGNAVPPLFAKAIAKEIHSLLINKDNELV